MPNFCFISCSLSFSLKDCSVLNIGFFGACSFFSSHFLYPLRCYHVLCSHGFMTIHMLMTSNSHLQPRPFLSDPDPALTAYMTSPPGQLMFSTDSKLLSHFFFFTKHVVEVQQTSLNIGKELLTLPFPLHLGLSTPIEYLERERIFTGVERPRSWLSTWYHHPFSYIK